MSTTQAALARRFHALHTGNPILALPNAWDVASARIVADAGAAAVATTSAGVAWSLGAPDGDQLDRSLALEAVARIAAAVAVPVTADIENGFAADAGGVADTVRGVLAAGAVGINLEDGVTGDAPLRAAAEQAERIAAARRAADTAGVPLFINARTDVFLRSAGEPQGRLDETLARAESYLAAGADGVFVPGVTDPATIGALAAGISAPLNVLTGPGTPPVAELARLGVARVSLGSAIAEEAFAVVRRASRDLLADGRYPDPKDALEYGELNRLLRGS